MELQELRKKNDQELRTMLSESQEKLRQLRFEAANLQLKDVRAIRQARKQIARIQTILKEREQKPVPSPSN